MLDLSCPDVIWWTGVMWMFLSAVWTLILTAPIHNYCWDTDAFLQIWWRNTNLGRPEGGVCPWGESDLIISGPGDSHSSPGRTGAASAPAALSASDWAQPEHDAALSAADADLEAPGACVSMNIHVWGILHDPYRVTCVTGNPNIAWHRFYQTCILKVSVFFCPYNGSQSGLVASFVFCRQVWNDRTVSKWQNSYIWVTVTLRWIFGNTCVTLEHKTSLKSLGYICSNNQQYIVWVKIINFSFMPKIIRILRSCYLNIFL